MAHIIEDRVRETTATTGTGALSLGGAATGRRTFASIMTTGDTCPYGIGDPGSAEWELGIGTMQANGTLVRTTVIRSSNANALVNLSAGSKPVYITFIGTRTPQLEPDLSLALPLVSSPTTPASGAKMYPATVAGEPALHLLGTSGLVGALFPLLVEYPYLAMLGPGSLTALSNFGITGNNTGTGLTVDRPDPSSASVLAALPRQTFATAASAPNMAGWRGADATVYRGATAGRGGFLASIVFGTGAVPASVTNAFVGLYDSTASPTAGAEPTSLTNLLVMGFNRGQGTWRVMHNDSSGTATSVDLGASFPVDTTSAYHLLLRALPNAGSVHYEVRNIGTGAKSSGTLSTDLPAGSTFLDLHFYTSINSGTTPSQLDIAQTILGGKP